VARPLGARHRVLHDPRRHDDRLGREPCHQGGLDPSTNNLDNVVWVTSAYLLAYAVPLLITGRLGDRFGPKRIYLIGLAIFTPRIPRLRPVGTLEMLIVFRAIQGLGPHS
jgi:MFS family permease